MKDGNDIACDIASRPVACTCPCANRQIHSSFQAGGMAIDRMRLSVLVDNLAAIGLQVNKTFPRSLSAYSRLRIGDIPQPRNFDGAAGRSKFVEAIRGHVVAEGKLVGNERR
jgi:hypothetical protein